HFACARKEAREPDLLAFALGVHEMTPVMERLDVIAHVAQASEDRLEARAFQARSESAGVVELRARTERLEGVAEVIDPGAKLARIGRRALRILEPSRRELDEPRIARLEMGREPLHPLREGGELVRVALDASPTRAEKKRRALASRRQLVAHLSRSLRSIEIGEDLRAR